MSFIKLMRQQGTNKIDIKTFSALLSQGKKNFINNLEEDMKIIEDEAKRDRDEIFYIITKVNEKGELTNSQWVELYSILKRYLIPR